MRNDSTMRVRDWDDDDPGKPAAARKDTKRWCRGKVGREHQPMLQRARNYGRLTECGAGYHGRWVCYHETVCSVCSKVLKHWGTADECPDYTEV